LFGALAAVGVAGAGVAMAPASASASIQPAGHVPHRPTARVLDADVVAPFQLGFGKGGLLVSDGGTSTVSRYTRKGLQTLAHGPDGGEVAGVAVNPRGDLAYTSSVFGQAGATSTALTIKPKQGGAVVTVDLLAYEKAHNPDGGVHYGIDNPTDCQKEALKPFGGASTTGVVDSHPYSVTAWGNNAWLVGEAGGNDLLKVDRYGQITPIAVLPRQPTTITTDDAKSLGLPDCVVGAVYNFDPVPTDVEISGNSAVVSLLPGGPEDPSFGARGSVYQVDLSTGASTKIAGGFLGATNIALASRGRIFVAELFGGQISVIENGVAQPYLDLPNVVSLAWGKDTLYAGTVATNDGQGQPLAAGSLVAIR
jgi:hypothetical protein